MKKKRIFASLLLTALVCTPLSVFYGRLDFSAMPPELAEKAVPAKRYELITTQFGLSEFEGTTLELNCYDWNDQLLRRISYAESEKKVYYSDYKYDRNGNQIYCLAHLGSIVRAMENIYTYDAQNRPLSKTVIYRDVDSGESLSNSTVEYTYNPDGTGQAVSDVPSIGKEISELDKEGRVVFKTTELGDRRWTAQYAYDHNGELRYSRVDTGEDVSENEFRRTYDEDGNCIACDTYQNGVQVGWETMRYENGVLCESKTDGLTITYQDVTR